MDAYSYAGYIKYNQNLFTPHHLFYKAFMYILISPLEFFGVSIDTLLFTKVINAFFAMANLFVFYKILGLLKVPKLEKLLYVIILGFTFSLWRFGTENETYIMPIFFSLLGSLYFLKYILKKNTNYIFISGLMGVLACLFHQVHFFWWLGLLIGFLVFDKRLKTFFLYSISAFLVPISYSLVLVFYEHKSLNLYNIIHFVFHDFYGGSIVTNFGLKGIFFQLLNSFRTFFQLHPRIFHLIKENALHIIPLLFGLYLLYRFVVLIHAKKMTVKRTNNYFLFVRIHLLIFLANYAFAFYSYGNVEFMVMLPFLLVLFLVLNYQVNNRFLLELVFTLFIWNFCYGIFPNYFYDYYNDSELVDYIIENPKEKFVIKNAGTVNEYFYKTGIDNAPNIILYSKVGTKEIDSILQKESIFTDLIDKPEILNREKLTTNNNLKNAFDKYNKEKIFDYKGFYGTSSVYKISP